MNKSRRRRGHGARQVAMGKPLCVLPPACELFPADKPFARSERQPLLSAQVPTIYRLFLHYFNYLSPPIELSV
jgi:hypothetical protein